ncbi:MAG: serine hydrolase [Bacteroidota bacterium]
MRSAVLICSLAILVLLVNSGDWLADQLVLRSNDTFLKNSLNILVNRELADKKIPGLAITVIDDQNVLFEDGFGLADPTGNVPASPYTVFQAGAVAQLFTTIAVLQRVEHNKLDLDAPIATYLPSFAPRNPYGLDLTLRQILSHQSGLVAEPPVGHYFDTSRPTLTQVVESINQTTVVFPPETFTKYSNAGFAVAGNVLEASLEKPFEQHMRAILDRMHLKRTSFTDRLDLKSKLAVGHISSLDDRIVPLDPLEIANGPANNLYTTVNDLGAFMKVLFADGLSPNGSILDGDAFEQMWTIQLSTARKQIPFGLGFAVSIFEDQRRATLTSNTHGFTTRIDLLPDQDLGVAIIANLAYSEATLEKLAGYALKLALAQKKEEATPAFPNSRQPDSSMVSQAIGYYINADPLYISKSDHNLYLYQDFNRYRLRQQGDSLIIDDKHAYGPILLSDGLTLQYNNTLYSKRNAAVPRAGAPRYANLTGDYGLPDRPITIVEQNNNLYALDGWNTAYTLTPDAEDRFLFPVDGLYGGESITFTRNETGEIASAYFANMPLPRLTDGAYADLVRTVPLEKPISGTAQPLVAPPESMLTAYGNKESEMVDLTHVDPLFNLDIRYATRENLLGTQIYSEARALLQRPVAEAVFSIQRQIRRLGYELVVYDTYQPWYISNAIWESVPDSMKYFFNDPQQSICQNNGTALSVGIFELNAGAAMPMPSEYDEMTALSYADSPLPEERLRWNRDFLRRLMESEGFTVAADKWWHFTHNSCPQYPVMNTPFAEVEYINTNNLQRIFTVDR